MRVLVTGANGHIGNNLLPLLVKEGHQVVPLVREKADTRGIDALGLTYARGDVQDPAALLKAAEGCDAVIHMAAVYSMSNDPAVVMAPAIEGSKNIIEAAKAHRIKRVVYTSSTVSVGTTDDPRKLDESSWSDGAVIPYAIAKRESERAAAKLAAEAGVELVIINPCGVLGRGDWRITPSNGAVLNWLDGTSQTVSGGLSYVDVRDVALAHARALTLGAAGERHIVCSVNFTMKELGLKLKELFGVRPMHMPAPRWMLIPMVTMIEGTLSLFGKEAPVTRTQAQEWANRYAWFDGSKAARVFGFEYRGLDDILVDTVRWLAHLKAFPPKLNARFAEQFPADPSWAAVVPRQKAA